MKKTRIAAMLLALSLLTACGSTTETTESTASEGTAADTTEVSTVADVASMDFTFTERELAGDYDEYEVVDLDDPSQTITTGGVYRLSGEITDTTITVAAGESDKVQIILDYVTITNRKGPAIYIQSADKVFLTVEGDCTISDGSDYTMEGGDTNVDGAIFSRADLAINGDGILTVNGNCGHAIVSKDDLVIANCTMDVIAQKVGLNGKDCVKICGASVQIDAGSDGIRSDNTEDADRGYVYLESCSLTITAGNDGIQAETVLKTEAADLTITTGGSSGASLSSSEESYKGLKAGSDILLNGGTYEIDSQDDCIHSNGNISISDGVFTLSSGDDGIHADTELAIRGGEIAITKSYEGLEASTIAVSGGSIDVVSADDGINAAGGQDSSAMGDRFGMGGFTSSTGEVIISGGYLVVDAAGDGLDSNGTLEITGGITLVSGPTDSANGTLDYENSAEITGGVLVALGSSGMVQSIAGSENQGVIGCTFNSQNGSFLVCDESGNVVVSFTPAKAYSCAVVSTPNITSGSTYSVVVGGEADGADANGYAENTTCTGGITLGSLEASEGYSSSGMGGGQGGMGGPGDMGSRSGPGGVPRN